MLDGFLARQWGVESKFGARLDSLADFVFVLAVGYKLYPWLKLPAVLWIMIGLIALVKTVNATSSYVVKHKIECLEQREPPNLFGWLSRDRQRHSQFLHTKANKLTIPTHKSQQIDRIPTFYRHDDYWAVILHRYCMDDCMFRPLHSYTGRTFDS